MAEDLKNMWFEVDKQTQIKLLRDFFTKFVLPLDECPTFMTESDWNELIDFAIFDIINIYTPRPKYCLVLCIEGLAYKYWVPGSNQFHTIVDFLMGLEDTLKLGDRKLLTSCSIEDMKLWLEFNL